MLSPELIDLAQTAGVFPEYWDVHGQHVIAEEETVRELLGVLGYDGTPGQELQEKERLLNQSWGSVLPPFVVFRQGSDFLRIELSAQDSEYAEFNCLKIVEEESGRGVQRIDLRLKEEKPIASAQIDGESYSRFKVESRCALPLGYYRLQLFRAGRVYANVRLIVAPEFCYQLPPDGRRHWGLAAQLYSLWSDESSRVGTYSDAGNLLSFVREQGGSVLGLNPLHALGAGNSSFISPYFPSTRAAYNFLYVDSERYVEEWDLRPLESKTTAAREDFVEYGEAFAERLKQLQLLFATISEARSSKSQAALTEFREYLAGCDASIKEFALFHALEEHFVSQGILGGWRSWPEPFTNPDSAAVLKFVEEHRQSVDFYIFTQWLCEKELERISSSGGCDSADASIGLYLDLALGARDDGAEIWGNQSAYVSGVSMGAPPDELAPQGQDWGLPPLHPQKLRESDLYPPY